MKKLIITLLFIACAAIVSFCSEIQIHAKYDNHVLKGYDVVSWNGKDGQEIHTPYSVLEAQTKFSTLLNPALVGTTDVPDRITMVYDSSDNLIFIQASNTSQTKEAFSPAPVKTQLDFTDQQLNDITASKVDVETKTGKTVGGKDPVK